MRHPERYQVARARILQEAFRIALEFFQTVGAAEVIRLFGMIKDMFGRLGPDSHTADGIAGDACR
jgi:hypothetical protein